MPIIHITIPDNDDALGVIAVALNSGYQVTIDLDDDLSDDDTATDIDHILARDRNDQARRRAVRNQGHLDAEMARDVQCEKCKAPIDHACISPLGERYSGFAHNVRIQAARKAAT
jgi:hypothetical protein